MKCDAVPGHLNQTSISVQREGFTTYTPTNTEEIFPIFIEYFPYFCISLYLILNGITVSYCAGQDEALAESPLNPKWWEFATGYDRAIFKKKCTILFNEEAGPSNLTPPTPHIAIPMDYSVYQEVARIRESCEQIKKSIVNITIFLIF